MAEIASRQSTNVAANKKVMPTDAHGRRRSIIITTPATFTAALNDTMGSGAVIPAGARFTADSWVSCAAGAASSTLSIGIRDPKTQEAIDATAIASGVAISSAGNLAANNGTKVAAGIEYVTTQPVEVYLTFTGATPQANQAIRVEVEYILD
ncbi:hypothetical protein [Ralstonia mannitolilytica]|uniref:hypothetical protein n=1 Tax=Ralstonia mannitolilytica TaxID=105219 RepID=UPI0007B01E94|nr:hypothetical protein [Ralstonia mannitolilytica]ANA34465.1 hypothetical protein VZ52_14300 [Ralstonia mannitolilytica]